MRIKIPTTRTFAPAIRGVEDWLVKDEKKKGRKSNGSLLISQLLVKEYLLRKGFGVEDVEPELQKYV